MTRLDLAHAEAMIKDYCDELIEEIKSLQEQLEDTKNENEKLKQLLTDAGVENDRQRI